MTDTRRDGGEPVKISMYAEDRAATIINEALRKMEALK